MTALRSATKYNSRYGVPGNNKKPHFGGANHRGREGPTNEAEPHTSTCGATGRGHPAKTTRSEPNGICYYLRVMRDGSDWKLTTQTFGAIEKQYGPLEVDLFASRLTNQCQRYYSWRPDPFAEAIDAFQQDWSRVKGFVNPPWSLITRILNQAQTQKAELTIITPLWKSQPWYALVLAMLIDWPRLPPYQQLISPLKGYQYSSVNACRSAIASVHNKVDGLNVGQHPTIVRLVKGVFNCRPPVPKYCITWDV